MAMKKKSVWGTPLLIDKINTLLREGKLVDLGMEKLFVLVKEEFLEAIKKEGFRTLPKRSFQKKVRELIWTKKVHGALKKMVRFELSAEKFHEVHKWIPFEMVKTEASKLSGVSNDVQATQSRAGIGRLSASIADEADDASFPDSSFSNPYVVPLKNPKKDGSWSFMTLNGANVGIKHNRVIEENPARLALSDAEDRGVDVVIVTGLIDLDLRKAAGPLKVYRAQMSGINTKIGVLAKSYQERAARILRDKPHDEVVYETAAERFLNLMSGWHKIAWRPENVKNPNGKLIPEYSGPVLVVIGYKEEELINTAAYWELRYITIVRWNKINAELKMVENALIEAYEDGTGYEIDQLEERGETLRDLRSRSVITEITGQQQERFRGKMRAFVVRKIEESIPNSKVIGQGTSYIKIGNEIAELNIPAHARVTNGLLSSYTRNIGEKIRQKRLADVVTVLHPYALQFRTVGRENNKSHGVRGFSRIAVAPIAVDGKFLREQLRQTVRKDVHPVMKAIHSTSFRPGILVVRKIGKSINFEPIPLEALGNYDSYLKRLKKASRCSALVYPGPKYIWVMTCTDSHWGSQNKVFVHDPVHNRYLGLHEGVMEMMRKAGLVGSSDFPVHFYVENDDGVQGHHFPSEKQPHQHKVSFMDIEDKWRDALKEAKRDNDIESSLRILAEMQKFNMEQFKVRGEIWTQAQMAQVFDRHIKPNLDFFSSVLQRNLKAGLIVRGISELQGNPHDNRDVGVINRGTGNHTAKSLEYELTEGFLYQELTRALLGQEKRWRGKEALLQKMVRSPLYSNQFFGLGSVQAPGAYEWGLYFTSSPNRVDWTDPLKNVINNYLTTGDRESVLAGMHTLMTFGDKHFDSSADTTDIFFQLVASGTETDLFGTLGFPPNNTAMSFTGLPVDGPESGPILVRTLHYKDVKYYIEDNPDEIFDWKNFLINPA